MGRIAPGNMHADSAINFVDLVVGRDLSDHLTVIGGGAEQGRVERDLAQQLAFDRLGELAWTDFGTARHPHLVEHEAWCALGRAKGLDGIGKVLGIAQIGEVWNGRDHHLRSRRCDPASREPSAG